MTEDRKDAIVGVAGLVGIIHALSALPVAVCVGLLTGIFALGLGLGWLYASYWINNQEIGDDDDPDEEEIPDDEERASVKADSRRPFVVDFSSIAKRRAT